MTKTRMLLEVVFIFTVAIIGYNYGFMNGVEDEKEDTIKRSVNFGDCKLVFHE